MAKSIMRVSEMQTDIAHVSPGSITRRSFLVTAGTAMAIAATSGLIREVLASDASDSSTFNESGLNYTIIADATTEDGLPCVSVGTGAQPDADSTGDASDDPSAVSLEIPAAVEHDGTQYAVTQIAPFAFQNYALEQISLPEGLQKISKGAFQFCRNLQQISIPSTVTLISMLAFFADSALSSVTFSDDSQLTDIGDGTFAILKTSGSLDNNDTTASLASIEFPATLKNLGSYAFYGQTSLSSVTFLGDTINEISPYAFGKCTALTRIDLPTITSTIERIGRYAFEDDTALETVTFQGGVSGMQTTQAGNEFSGCANIQTVIYHQKKWNAQNHGMNPDGSGQAASAFQGNFSFGSGGFEDSPNVKEYYTVRQYASADDAEAGGNATGEALVLAGTALHEICAGTCDFYERDDSFAAGAWAFEDNASVGAGLDDSLYAYPCDGSDLSYGAVVVDTDTYDDDDYPVLTTEQVSDGSYTATVWDAAGSELVADQDYALAFEEGTPQAPGTYTLVAAGSGSYQGEAQEIISVVQAADTWIRLTGDSWSRTAQLAIQATFENASTAQTPCDWAIVVAGGSDHTADACVAAALAGALGAPIVPTDGTSLSDEASYEINRVGASTVVVVGDTDAVSDDVASQLESLYIVDKLYRIAGTGTTGANLDMRVATLAKSLGVTWSGTCIIAAQGDVTSALVASSYAYATSSPLIWAGDGNDDAGNGISADVAAALAGAGITSATVLDSTDTIPQGATDALEAAGISCTRVGEDASDQSALTTSIASWGLENGLGADGSVVFSSDTPELAVGAAALAGRANAICLTSDVAVSFLSEHASDITIGYVLGSSQDVSDDVLNELEALS